MENKSLKVLFEFVFSAEGTPKNQQFGQSWPKISSGRSEISFRSVGRNSDFRIRRKASTDHKNHQLISKQVWTRTLLLNLSEKLKKFQKNVYSSIVGIWNLFRNFQLW